MSATHNDPRAQLERAGLGEPQDRPCPFPPLRGRYSELLTIQADVAAAAVELVGSKRLHQPFRINSVALQGDELQTSDVRVNLLLEDRDDGTGSSAERERAGVWQGRSELAGTNEVTPGQGIQSVTVGLIVRDVPTRIVLAVQNNTAGAVFIAALVDVTYLEERPPAPPADYIDP